MRIALPLGRSLFFLCMVVIALLASIPMRLGFDWLGIDDRGIAAREARGSVWNGELSEAQLGGAAVGDVDAGLGFLPLLIGRARVAIEREAAEGQLTGGFQGALSVSGSDFGIDGLTANLPVADLFAPLPITTLHLEELSARFENGLCVDAEGTARADIAGTLGGIPLPATAAGAARCDQGQLLLPMIGQSGMDRIEIRIDGSGRYSAQVIIRPADAGLRERILAAGFRPVSGGYAIGAEGRF